MVNLLTFVKMLPRQDSNVINRYYLLIDISYTKITYFCKSPIHNKSTSVNNLLVSLFKVLLFICHIRFFLH